MINNWFGKISSVLTLVVSVTIFTPQTALTQESETWKVGTKSLEPFVYLDENGEVDTGYSIELWEQIAAELDIEYEWVVFDTVGDMIAATQAGKVDVAIAGISITSNREKLINFSHGYYESGLHIMILNQPTTPLLLFLRTLISLETLEAITILLGLCFLSANLIWFAERYTNKDMFPKQYWSGIWEALWWSLVTATTVGYGDKYPVSFIGRIIGVIWMFAGLFVVAYFTSAITVNRLKANISTPEDLINRRVAAVAGTTAEDFLRDKNVKIVLFQDLESAYQALENNQVKAIVGDAPILLYHTSNNPKFRVLGELFAKQDYGIAFPENEREKLEAINQVLLEFQEKEIIQKLNQEWFYSNQGS